MPTDSRHYDFPARELQDSDFCLFCTAVLGVAPARVRADIDAWLDEDAGHGDTAASLLPNTECQAFLVAKQDFTLACLPVVAEVFRRVSGGHTRVFSDFSDGDSVRRGSVVLAARGAPAALVLAERTGLNLGARMSGVATATRHIVDKVRTLNPAGAPQILETRKTTPGLRLYEKYATRVGGARNHRHGLDSGLMLKENHLRAFGGIPAAVAHAAASVPILSRVEIEVTSLAEFREALSTEADVIMLDNFSADDVLEAVRIRNQTRPAAKLEISGNLDGERADWVARSGVDYASMGALIHQAVWIDWSLQLFVCGNV